MLNLNIRLYELYNNKKNERVNAKIILLTSTELTSIYVLRTLYSTRVHVLLEIILKSNTYNYIKIIYAIHRKTLIGV